MHANLYIRLAAMAILSFIVMYILMYAMVDRFANVFPNVNQFYMAAMMTAAMIIIEAALMWGMYANRIANIAIVAACVVAMAAFFFLIRQQAAVADVQFLKSMIPHHASAILMCERASLKDGEVKRLCNGILRSQRSEIGQMKTRLNVLNK